MNQRALFWMPVLMRLGLVAVVMLAASFLWSGVIGLLLGFLLVLILALIQLNYLYRLSLWLENPEQVKLADGFGAWTDVFARLYRLRREDEKNRHELAEWLSRFRKAMSLLPDGVVIMDDVLFLEWCNPVAEQHLGLALERDKGMRVVHLIPFENRRQILVTHDVTEAERLEQTRRDFIANASHELRTPLTVINGFLEIATGDDVIDPEVRRQHLQLMLEQGKRMQHLVEDMLSLTRLESIDYPVRAEPIDMHVMMEELKRDGDALSAGRHHIKLLVEDVALAGSNDELHSAFSNLVSNAVRYTPVDGNIDVIWRDSEAGPQFIVRDNGIGIRPEHIVRLTERFYRVDKGRSRASQGTGLGLAIVKHVLMRHNATLKIESEPGKGSAFIAQFPKVTALKA
jgi:two-component system phosphate regulon sensor histidine kinase PhoR